MDLPPALINGVGAAGLLALVYWALLKEWISPGSVTKDLRSQRDRADDRADKLLEINAIQSEALRDFARKEDLGVKALQAVERKVAEGGDQ